MPIRSWKNDIIGGTYRQEMARQFNDIIYPRRQLVENKFSVLKRKFNGDLKARRFLIQMKEIANKMIVCNIHRFLRFLISEVFYRAEKIKFFRFAVFCDIISAQRQSLPVPQFLHTWQVHPSVSFLWV